MQLVSRSHLDMLHFETPAYFLLPPTLSSTGFTPSSLSPLCKQQKCGPLTLIIIIIIIPTLLVAVLFGQAAPEADA